jgi:hypothetical protein
VIIGWYRHEHPSTAIRIPDGYEPEPALRWNISVGLRRAGDALVAAVDAPVARVVEQRIPAQIYAKYDITYLTPSPPKVSSKHQLRRDPEKPPQQFGN